MDYSAALTIFDIGTRVTATSDRYEWTGAITEKGADRIVIQEDENEYGRPVRIISSLDNPSFTIPEPTVEQAEVLALEAVESAASQATTKTIQKQHRQIAILGVWDEIQRYKMFTNLPTQDAQLRRQFPTLTAYATLKSIPLADAVTQLEPRFWPRIRRNALWEAKLLVAHDNVRAATTVEDKIAAADGISWQE